MREIKDAGYRAIEVEVDTRDFESIQVMVKKTVQTLGRLDAVVYNSGAVWWASVAQTPQKRFQLMQRVNVEGLYGTIQASLPYFDKQEPCSTGRFVVVSPPIYSRFFRGKTAYSIGKVGMSVLTKGLAMDFEREKKSQMAITSIWPAATIQSGATRDIPEEQRKDLRTPKIFAEAILQILRAPAASVNGLITTDEDFLREVAGFSDADIDKYSLIPGSRPRRIMPKEFPNLRVTEHDDEAVRRNSTELRQKSGEASKL